MIRANISLLTVLCLSQHTKKAPKEQREMTVKEMPWCEQRKSVIALDGVRIKLQYRRYADDGFGVVSSNDKAELVRLIESKVKRIETWLVQSGMQVNESKTCLCLFYHRDTAPIEIVLNNVKIKSVNKINVLGVIFDQKLQWSDHISHCISKSNKALTAIKFIYMNLKGLNKYILKSKKLSSLTAAMANF